MQTKTLRKPRQQQKGGLRDRIQNRAMFGTVVFIAICVVGIVCIVIKAYQVGSAFASSPLMEGLTSSVTIGKAIELRSAASRPNISRQEREDIEHQLSMLNSLSAVEGRLPWGFLYSFQIDQSELEGNPQLAQHRLEIMERLAPLRGYIKEFVDDLTESKFYETCERLKLETVVIEQVISETESRSSDIGEENADIIVSNLQDLIESINQAEEYDTYEDY